MVARWASGGGALAGVMMLLAAPISDVIAVASVTAGAHGPWSAGGGVAAKGAGQGAMRLRGGFVRTLAPSVQARGVPHSETLALEGEEEDEYKQVEENMPSNATVETVVETTPSPDDTAFAAFLAQQEGQSASLGEWGKEDLEVLGKVGQTGEVVGGEVVGNDEVAEDPKKDASYDKEKEARLIAALDLLREQAHPLQRASVNADTFDKQACGRNMLIGSMGKIPFPFRSIPIPLPSPLRLSLPMMIPLPFARENTRVRLKSDQGTWLNHLVKSPVAPAPGVFSPRRLDPIEAQQRRPFTAIPLDVTGPMRQPHPYCQPLKESEVSGGMAYSMGEIGAGSLSYMEVRAGGPSKFSSVGIVDVETTLDDEGETRQADFSGSPRGDCISALASGAFVWALDGSEKVKSDVASKRRGFRAGDRVGILVDQAEGRMAVLKNGRVVLTRSGIPTDRAFRFFVGCHAKGASWSMIKPHSARKSLENVDWLAFYSA